MEEFLNIIGLFCCLLLYRYQWRRNLPISSLLQAQVQYVTVDILVDLNLVNWILFTYLMVRPIRLTMCCLLTLSLRL